MDESPAEPAREGTVQKILNALSLSKDLSLEGLAKLQKGGRDLQGPLNAVFGDSLERAGSSLALPMRLYRKNSDGFEPVEITKDSFRERVKKAFAGGDGVRLCIFVHGLGSSERTWLLRRKGSDRPVDYATLLERDTGHTCYFVRYNTGRHISTNGRDFAELLESLVRNHDVPVRELNLIGHSMGGLVLRSAGYYGTQARHRWVSLVRGNFLLGSPLLGAHQEQIGKLTSDILSLIPLPGVQWTAQLVDLRSAGIQDLGYGYLRDEDWQSPEAGRASFENRRNPVPLLKHARYYLVIGSLSKDPQSIAGTFLGDGVVHRWSARGAARREHYEEYTGAVSREIPGLSHIAIPGDARVYRSLRDWLRAG